MIHVANWGFWFTCRPNDDLGTKRQWRPEGISVSLQLMVASLKTAQLDRLLFDLHFALGVDSKVTESTKCGPIWWLETVSARQSHCGEPVTPWYKTRWILYKDFGLTYTNVVRLENVRLVRIRNLMSPSPELDLDCQLQYLWSGNRPANRSFLRYTLQNVSSLLVSSLTN